MQLTELLMEAKKVSHRAYAPYSQFRVGAALETVEGKIFLGVNVENRSFGLTNCAERTAIYKAISEGYSEFKALAVFTPDAKGPISPCGACRQVISEFTSGDFPIIFGHNLTDVFTTTTGEICPFNDLHDLKKE